MKKIILLCLTLGISILLGYSQAKKPIIMVVPSDAWCVQNGFVMEFDNQGTMEVLPDYNVALQNDADLLMVISKIGEMMAERGFPLKDLGASLKSLRTEAAEDALATSQDGDGIGESPLDKLKKVAKADIIMQLTYKINKVGPNRSVSFNLQGLDAYTNKQVAAASGTGEQSFSTEIPVMLQEAVLAQIDGFNSQLQAFFDDLFANGREISLVCRRWSGAAMNFETEYEGEELGFLVEGWVAGNTVNGRFSTSDATENRLLFEQVRIPLYAENGRAMDARTWANGLRKTLKEKYGIDAKLGMKGLGQAIITIGAK